MRLASSAPIRDCVAISCQPLWIREELVVSLQHQTLVAFYSVRRFCLTQQRHACPAITRISYSVGYVEVGGVSWPPQWMAVQGFSWVGFRLTEKVLFSGCPVISGMLGEQQSGSLGGKMSPATLDNQNRAERGAPLLATQTQEGLCQWFQGSGALNSRSSHAVLAQSFSTVGFSIPLYPEVVSSRLLLISPSKKCVWIFTTVPN